MDNHPTAIPRSEGSSWTEFSFIMTVVVLVMRHVYVLFVRHPSLDDYSNTRVDSVGVSHVCALEVSSTYLLC